MRSKVLRFGGLRRVARPAALIALLLIMFGLAGASAAAAAPEVDPNCSQTRMAAGECVREASATLTPAQCDTANALAMATALGCGPQFSFAPGATAPTAPTEPVCLAVSEELKAATNGRCFTLLTDVTNAQLELNRQKAAARAAGGDGNGIVLPDGGPPSILDPAAAPAPAPGGTSQSDAETQARDQAIADQAAAAAAAAAAAQAPNPDCPQARLGEPCDAPGQGQGARADNLFGRGDGYPVSGVVLYYGSPEWKSPGWNPGDWGDWLANVVIEATNMFNGWIANGIFAGFKYAIYGAMQLTGVVVFAAIVFAWLLEPAVQLNDTLNWQVAGPMGLVLWILIGASVLAALSFARGRVARAFQRLLFAVVMLGLITLAVPRDIFVGAFNTAGAISGVILVTLSGDDPRTLPAPNLDGAVLEQTGNLQYYHTLSRKWEEVTISGPAQLLTFGELLQGRCKEIWEEGVAKGYDASEKAALDALAAEPDCVRFAQDAAVADADRAIFAFGFLLMGMFMCLSLLFLMLVNAEAQLKAIFYLASFFITARFAAISAGATNRYVRNCIKAVARMIVTAILLSGVCVFGDWWATASAAASAPMILQIAPVCLMPAALIVGMLLLRKRFEHQVETAGSEGAGHYPGAPSHSRALASASQGELIAGAVVAARSVSEHRRRTEMHRALTARRKSYGKGLPDRESSGKKELSDRDRGWWRRTGEDAQEVPGDWDYYQESSGEYVPAAAEASESTGTPAPDRRVDPRAPEPPADYDDRGPGEWAGGEVPAQHDHRPRERVAPVGGHKPVSRAWRTERPAAGQEVHGPAPRGVNPDGTYVPLEPLAPAPKPATGPGGWAVMPAGGWSGPVSDAPVAGADGTPDGSRRRREGAAYSDVVQVAPAGSVVGFLQRERAMSAELPAVSARGVGADGSAYYRRGDDWYHAGSQVIAQPSQVSNVIYTRPGESAPPAPTSAAAARSAARVREMLEASRAAAAAGESMRPSGVIVPSGGGAVARELVHVRRV